MNRWAGKMVFTFVVSLVLAGTAAIAEQVRPGDATTRTDTAGRACLDVAGMSEQDRNAMREFMRSDRAPEMMGRMMQMARGMGNGDVIAGMTRMMDMMGSTGRDGMMGGSAGMMGGQGGMMGDRGGMRKSAPPSK
jgi:hypothetical protein